MSNSKNPVYRVSWTQDQAVTIENYIIERLRKAFPDSPGGRPRG